ncbi:MAG: hypothetical protein IJH12_06120 [Clostridia bacterium]|nr:hypothetical protein [Clostridia bacterium]
MRTSGASNVKLIVYSKEYKGDGYFVIVPPVTDATIYEFWVGDNCVYSAVINNWFGSDDTNELLKKNSQRAIVYVILCIIMVMEVIFFILYKKQQRKKVVEDKKTV